MTRRPGLLGTLLGSCLLAFVVPGSLSGQEVEPTDSTELRILERLRRLSRPPGYDSVLFLQDSIRTAQLAGDRPVVSVTGPDSVTAQLLAIPGYSLTEYEAESANFASEDRTLELTASEEGRARVDREGLRVEADTSITFNEATGRMRTVGDATFTPPQGDPVQSVQMIYDLSEARGSAIDARTEFSQAGATWQLRGDMPFAATDSTYMSHARFTSCELEEPHYHFESDQIKVVGGKVMVARGVRLYFGDVPVAWLPFIAQSLSQGRSSGLLTPRFSINDIIRTSQGYRRRLSNLGFYWAMSDYTDAVLAMDWFSDTFVGLTGALQYRFNRQFLTGGINMRRYWRESGTELAFSTNHAWQVDERTRLQLSGNYATSNDFVRENSLNPLEVTQSIDSNGGFNRRFDWGSLDLAVNRQQYLSDDRTTWTLPSLSLSLSPITLFRAAPDEEHFWNNMTWSGSSNVNRSTVDYLQPATFSLSTASTVNTTARASSSFAIGNLRLSQSVNAAEAQTLGVPEALLVQGDSASPDLLLTSAPARNIARSNVSWTTSLGYQQQLVGSTTLTPRLSVSGSMLRSDTDSLAQSFVSAPLRASFGATLKTDIYGFFPGFGSFEAVRHKLSPSFSYDWSPSSQPNSIQQVVFGSRALQAKNALSVTLNQTFEARRASDESADSVPVSDSLGLEDLIEPTRRGGEPRRLPQAQTVKLLGLTTSVVRYDFVEADSVGSFLAGFETTQLSNQITSDYLRGLSVALNHDLFDDTVDEGGRIDRRFAPHLSGVNLSFSLGSSSSIFRWLGLTGGDDVEEPEEPEREEVDLFRGPTDESSMIPVGRADVDPEAEGPARGGRGGWTANLSYSLQRPRDGSLPANQMLTGGLTLRPTELWDVSWRTSYDLERAAFNDHIVRLTRDLHRWQAHFDFTQTATGNWSFRFEVSLTDNRDLKFDYNQRNLDVGLPIGQR